MVRLRSRIGSVPVLGGLALALTVLATMIGGVVAEPPPPPGNTVCNRCWNNAWARANTEEICPDSLGQEKHACIYNYAVAQCYGGSNPVCPSDDEAPYIVTCAGMLGSGVCENGAEGICNNATWNVNCDAADTNKKCQDKQVPPMGTATPCHVSCLCQE